MKKNLRNILVLSLGLITTIASAQWSANSTTWIDNTNSDDRTGLTRSTVSMDMSGVHISGDHYWGTDGSTRSAVYEAYVSTDVMGFGTLTIGRQDLSFGSGALVSSNEWGWGYVKDRWTTDGMDFAASFAGININAGTMGGINTTTTYMNASGSFSGFAINALMIDDNEVKSHGYDLGYSMMGGALGLSYSMNDDGLGSEMTEMGMNYQVMDNISINASMRSYEGDDTDHMFTAANSAWNDGLNAGVVGHWDNGTEILSYGIVADFAGIGINYTMHTASEEGYEDSELTDMSLTYDLNDNCTLGYRTYTFDSDGDGENEDYKFITIGIGL